MNYSLDRLDVVEYLTRRTVREMHLVKPISGWSAMNLLLLLLLPAMVFANPWSLEIRQWHPTRFENSEQKDLAAIKRGQFSISYRWSREQGVARLSYVHQPVLIRNGDPAHNGYFHQLDLSLRIGRGPTRVEFTTGIHASSNMFKQVDFHREALVTKFNVMHTLSNDTTRIGINGDYRFGHFRLYPRLSISKTLSKDSELTIDLPVALLWRKHNWQIGIKRHGEKWAALDSESKSESAFYLNEWRFGARWQVPVPKDKVTFELGAGVSFDSGTRYLDLVRGWQEEDLRAAVFVALAMKF